MSATTATRWCTIPAPLPDRRLRLLCFPYAGAGASCYFQWVAALRPLAVEVCGIQLPGRENRLRELPLEHIAPLADAVTHAIEPLLAEPYVFFGHSMGALVAFEVTRRLHDRGAPLPRHFFVSGARAPQIPRDEEPLRLLPDEALIREVASRYGGIPNAVIDNPELVELVLPALRADISVIETYAYRHAPPIRTPITAMAGREDPHVDEGALDAWQVHTTGPFASIWFPGDHFYLQRERAGLISAMTPGLREALAHE